MIKIDFDKQNGLIPVIVQDYKTGEILMLAYMNEEAWKKTQKTKKAHYYSRSRKKQWMKGEESGNIQEVKEIYVDCDEDTVLLKVNQMGDAACHTGYRSCFYRNDIGKIIGKKIFNPEEKYGTA
jgi:phosphoribosyl-AMP cyclohydrolase